MLEVINPANGEPIAELAIDTPETVAAKYAAARAAQPAWAAVPLEHRLEMLQRFRATIAGSLDKLAAILTAEVGKPIKQSRTELNGLLGRIDFFLEHTEATLADRVVHDADGMRERIEHAPLGVVANLSAWNSP